METTLCCRCLGGVRFMSQSLGLRPGLCTVQVYFGVCDMPLRQYLRPPENFKVLLPSWE